MRNFNIKGVEPVEVLEKVKLPFPKYSDEMPGDKRPIVNIYRYRFDNDFGIEVSFEDKISSGHVRFLLYKKDSNSIKKFGRSSWSNRSVMRHIVKICMSRDKDDRTTTQEWKKTLLVD
jgi:hypothetical protein